MPTYQLLTDRSLAQSSAITPTTLIHIVYTGDPSQNIAGSSYKAELGQLVGLFSGGSVSGDYLPLSGGTVSGATNFTNGLTANTISATTYQNLPGSTSTNCITDLYVSNIHSCSPLYINPFDEGDVLIGSTSLFVDSSTYHVGIGIYPPQARLHVNNTSPSNSLLVDDSTNPDTTPFVIDSIGNTGIGTLTPSEKLDVSGKTKTTNFQMTSGATNSYVLTSDASGNASWQASTGGGTFTGGTVSGSTNFTNGLTANTVSATTYLNLPQFSGGSGNCITDLYTSNIHSCSPLNINPLDEGNVYFGSTSGVTVDVTNSRVGIGTDSPNYPLQILGGTDTFYYDPFSSAGGVIVISGDSNVPRVSVQTYNSPISNIALGIRSITDTANSIYGKTGDTFLYASQSVNGINIANSNGTGTEDYIRFYAGKSAISTNTPDIHIQGSGSTKGYIGINNSNPQYRLDILDTDNRLYYDPSSAGGTLSLSGNTKLPRYDFIASPYLTKPLVGGSIGVRAWDDVTYGGYGNVGDIHIYANNSTNGLNIINQGPGTDTEDYIRFYAGRDALFDPDIHIQGSGSTRGYVGIGTTTPNYRLDVNGDTNISGNLNVTGTTTQSGGVIRKTKNTSLGLIVSNYNVLDTDNIIYVALTGVGGTRTVTLPTITTTNDGRVITIVYVSTASGGVNLSLVASGTDTINGSASKTGNAVYDTITVIANNSIGVWYILNEYPAGAWV